MKLFALFFLFFCLLSSSFAAPRLICGAHLMAVYMKVCGSRTPLPLPESTGHRSLVESCCRRGCSTETIKQYCGDDDDEADDFGFLE